LTFNWSIINFLSYLENSVALSHISELHTLSRKSSHTHALHELSNLFKISIHREFCANWTLNSQLYLCIFLNVVWLLYQLIIHAFSEADFRVIFLQIFLQFLFFSVKCSDDLLLSLDRCGTDGQTVRWHIWMHAVLSYAYVAFHVRTS